MFLFLKEETIFFSLRANDTFKQIIIALNQVDGR